VNQNQISDQSCGSGKTGGMPGGMPSFGAPSPVLQSADARPGAQPPHMQYRSPTKNEERELEEQELEHNSLAWMAPDFDLEELL